MNLKRLALLSCVAFGIATPAFADDWYSRGHGQAPQGNQVYICHGYTCRIVTPVRFTDAELRTIAGVLETGSADAAAERDAVSTAVQSFETIVGEDAVGDQHHHSRLEKIVVERAQKLRGEQRQESPARKEPKRCLHV